MKRSFRRPWPRGLAIALASTLSLGWLATAAFTAQSPPDDDRPRAGARDDGERDDLPHPPRLRGRRGPGGPPPPPSPLMHVLDKDADGVLSAAEIKGAIAALKTLDKDNDGTLSREELRPPRAGRGRPGDGPPPPPDDEPDRGGPRRDGPPRDDDRGPGPRSDRRPPGPPDRAGGPPPHRPDGPEGPPPPPGPILRALDKNHDGALSAAEIKNAVAALKTLDRDGDGVLSHEELRPPRPGRPDGPPRRGRRPGPPPRDGERPARPD